jgi:regulator of replication initiation timing
MASKETTQDFMLHLADARIKKLVNDNKALQADNDRLHDLLDESEDNVKRLSLLISNPRLEDALC